MEERHCKDCTFWGGEMGSAGICHLPTPETHLTTIPISEDDWWVHGDDEACTFFKEVT